VISSVTTLAARGLFALALVSSPLASAFSTHSSWSVQSWRSDDGLPNNDVTGIAQTPDGYLWVATFSRPARFDGEQFEEFFLKNIVPDFNDKLTALAPARKGGLWMGMQHGTVILLNANAGQLFTNGLPDKAVQAILQDQHGALWITYQGATVYRIDASSSRAVPVTEGMPLSRSRSVCSLALDDRGRVWAVKDGVLGLLHDGRFEMRAQLSDATARLTAANSGGLWVCSGSRLFRYRDGQKIQDLGTFFPALADAGPTALLEGRNGDVWIGTADNGLFHYDGSGFENVTVSAANISSLFEDREGNLWVGTGNGGLNRVRPRVVRLETADTGLPFNTVQSVCEDRDGLIWVTTQNGALARREGSGWKTISAGAGWPGGRASCVAADETGAVWVGTRDHLLHCWKDGQFRTWARPDGIVGREIHALVADHRGDLWIGEESPDVVQRLHGGKLQTFEMPPGIRVIRAMAEDRSGNIWAGTTRGILLKLTADGVVTDETSHTTGVPLSIRCLHAGYDGTLWIGYADDGIGWLRNGCFFRATSAQGLSDDTISQIVLDRDGWVWLGSDHGIFKVRQSELEHVAKGAPAKLRCVRYGQSEGLLSVEATVGDSPGALCTSDNEFLMPLRTGLAVIDPRKLPEQREPPPVLIRQVSVDDHVVAAYRSEAPASDVVDLHHPGATLTLAPSHRRLKFAFTALSFAAPENVVFKYRLQGFDEDWVDTGNQRTATYPKLPPGRYQFAVMACNGDGVWSDAVALFTFSVRPFLWQTWWFRIGAIALFLGATAGVVRYVSFRRLRSQLQKLEQQAALDRERARIARDIHDDLGGRLTQAELLIAMAQRSAPEERDGRLRDISSTVRAVGESLDEIVWAVNPRHDTLPHLLNYVGQFAIEFLQSADIRCRVDFPDNPPRRALPPEIRHSLFLAIKETLNNVVRHSGASEAWIRASVESDALNLTIEDNGQGMKQKEESQGADGLRNMRQRMEEMGGRFEIQSRPSGGTRVLLVLPGLSQMQISHGNGNGEH
jgi:ligand-binding sensor domain-containing protein/signal transduction histidine kinase